MEKCSKEPDIVKLKTDLEYVQKKICEHDDSFEKVDEMFEKVNERQNAIYELAQSIAVLVTQMTTITKSIETMQEDLKIVKKEVTEIQTEDGKTWKAFKWLFVSGVVLGYVAYLLKFILK